MNRTRKFLGLGIVAVGLTAFGLVGGTAAQAAGLPPVGQDDYYTVPQGGSLTIPAPGILANDVDPEGDPVSMGIDFGYTAADFVQVNTDGSFTFTPSPAFYGEAGFNYYPFDDALGNQTVVHITVTPTDPATPVVLVVNPDNYSTPKDTVLTVPGSAGIYANDVGPGILNQFNGPNELALAPDGGFVFTPAPGFVGTRTFGYNTRNGMVQSNDALVTIVVTDPGAPPIPIAPVANPDSYSTVQDTSLTVPKGSGLLLNDSFPAGSIVNIDDLSGEIAGMLDGSFVYTPAAGFVGTKEFSYRMTDGVTPSNWAKVSITVTAAPVVPPVAAAPVANPDSYSTVQDTTLTVPAGSGLLVNDSFPAGAVVDIDDASGEIVAQLDGSFVYTPAAGFVGTKEFSYRMSDNSKVSNWAKASITVTAAPVVPPVAGAPVANPDSYSTVQDTTLTVPAGSGLLVNDSFPAGAVVDIDDASGEIVAQLDGSFIYTPVKGFVGTKEFAYRMSDNKKVSDWAAVTITVTAAPTTPVDPTMPVDPTTPGNPATPADPGTPAAPVDLGSATATSSRSEELPTLAYTGSTSQPSRLLAPALALLALGGFGLWKSRRRTLA